MLENFFGCLINPEIVHDIIAIDFDNKNYRLILKNCNPILLNGSSSFVDIFNRIQVLQEKYVKNEKWIDLEKKVDEMYYSPTMPGAIKAQLDYNQKCLIETKFT